MEDGLKKVIRLAKTISNPIASSEMSWELKINQLICKKIKQNYPWKNQFLVFAFSFPWLVTGDVKQIKIP